MASRKNGTVKLMGFDVRINQGLAPFDLYEDIVLNHVYDFQPETDSPRILDCGSNIGMSVLYFKHLYPNSTIVAFEPDPTILVYLKENVERNGLEGVDVIRAALAAEPGTLTLNSDGGVASHLSSYKPDNDSDYWTTFDVDTVRLSDYLAEPVDYMKMNIEGAEHEVLTEIEPVIRQIREMNIEYHRLPGVPCTLHAILELLDRNGFQYVVSDFGLAMYGRARPPATVESDAMFWRQIYARRRPDNA